MPDSRCHDLRSLSLRAAGLKKTTRQHGRRRRPPVRLCLEVLENRLSPAILLDPNQLTIAGSSSVFHGTPFTAALVDGVAQFKVAGDLSLAAGDTVVVAPGRPVSLVVAGNFTLPAGAALDTSADDFTLSAAGTFNLAGSIAARGSLTLAGNLVVNSGAVHADGASGGRIDIQAASFQNSGAITADGSSAAGGTVRVNFTGSYIETGAGLIAADSTSGPGGSVTIDGGTSGHLFTSGRQ